MKANTVGFYALKGNSVREFTKVFKDPSGDTALSVLSSRLSPRSIAGIGAEEFVEAVKQEHPEKH
jgi:hypothetical protein